MSELNKLLKQFIGSDQVDGSKILLENGEALRAKKSGGGEKEVLKVNSSDNVEFSGDVYVGQQKLASESSVDAKILIEKQRAEGAEQSLDQKIASEKSRAELAESQLQSSITSGVAEAKSHAEAKASEAEVNAKAYADIKDSEKLAEAKSYADSKISELIGGAPAATLDTIKEIADALQSEQTATGSILSQLSLLSSDVADLEIQAQSIDADVQALESSLQSTQAALTQEISDRQSGDVSTLASSKDYTDQKVAAIPVVDLSNYYIKSEVDAKDAVLSSRISALEVYDQETVHVDNVNGVDEAGRGSMLRPFKTINYAYSQVESLGNQSNTAYNANVGRFVTEKLVIHLAPGRYAENVVLGFKRARVRITGDGATIVGDVKMSVKLADFPASNLENLKSSFPTPYTGASAFMNFEVVGKSGGGGLESDPTANVLVVTGQVSMAFEETTVPGSGVIFPNWDGSFGQFYAYLRGASVGNFVVTTSHNAATPTLPAGVIEIESCNIASTSATFRMHTGIVPYAYLADFATWNTATKGTTNKTPSGTWTLKAHNSTFGNVIGPRLTIGEMDGCRIYDIDRTMRGTVDNGAISGSTSTSYLGIVNNQFRIYGGSGDLASAYKIGQASGSTRYKIDSVSYTTLAFSRNSSGVLSARTLDVGGGVSYDLLDDARSIFVSDPATHYTRSANNVDSALEGIDIALGLKANQSSIASIEANVGSLQSSVSTLQSTTSSLQAQVNTEKGRIDAILSASQADKDSFAEIVGLINSVDTANDTAFAGYVLSNNASIAGLDSRLVLVEAKPAGDSYAPFTALMTAPNLEYVDLDRQVKAIMSAAIGHLVAREGKDFSKSVVNGVTRITFINGFAQGGATPVQANQEFHVVYAFQA